MLRTVFLSLFTLFLAACVTINVYFPAAAAEKAADQIIDQVWGDKPIESENKDDVPEQPDPLQPRAQNNYFHFIVAVLISDAYAQADLDISSPKIQALKARMAERHRTLEVHYDSGAVGLTYDGLIALRDPKVIPLRLRNPVKKAVEEENIDRLDLYLEIAAANGHPEWEPQIRETFAKRWIDKAKTGWWYQNEQEEWLQK